MTEAVVETHGLRKRFGEKVAVEDLSLVVKRGEIFGFLGPNGAGKTTSLKMLLGLVEPTSGSARVLGAPLGARRARARLGFLPEHFRFQEWLTGRELLHFHGRLYGLRGRELEARADQLLARVNLLDAAHRPIRTYSKGMMQRVGLAQALLNQPELVFLDEPTSGLDPLGRLLVRDIIRELRDRGTSVFLNSHLLGEVEATCDRVAFVKAGRTVHELILAGAGSGLDVELRLGPLENGTLEALARFGAIEPAPGAESPITAAGLGAAASGERRLRLRVAEESALPEIARMLVGRGVALYEMKTARKSLEAWFLEVMGDEQRPRMSRMRDLLTITHLTLHEAMRRRILTAALICGGAFLALFAAGLYFMMKEVGSRGSITVIEKRVFLNVLTLAGLYAANLLMIMTAVLLPVDTLSGEIGTGVIQTLASKPIRRSDIVLGKWLGHWLVMAGYFALLTGGVLVISRTLAHFTPPRIERGLPLMLLEGTLLLTLSIAGGTRLSTVTNGMMAFGLFGLAFIGNWVEQIGTMADNDAARYVGTVASLIMPSESLWQLAASQMQPALLRELGASPFSPLSVPSVAMLWWAVGYIAVAMMIGLRAFQKRPL